MAMKLMHNGHLRIFLAICIWGAVAMFALVIFGCTSTSAGIPNLWMAEITSVSSSSFWVHAGIFGICLVTKETTKCSNSANAGSKELTSTFNEPQATPLLEIALLLQKKIILYLVVVGGLFHAIGALSATIQYYSHKTGKTEKPRKILFLYRASIIPFVAALAFTLAASLVNTQVLNALHWITQVDGAEVRFKTGQVLEAMQWLLVALMALICLGTWLLHTRDHTGLSAFKKGGTAPMRMSENVESEIEV